MKPTKPVGMSIISCAGVARAINIVIVEIFPNTTREIDKLPSPEMISMLLHQQKGWHARARYSRSCRNLLWDENEIVTKGDSYQVRCFGPYSSQQRKLLGEGCDWSAYKLDWFWIGLVDNRFADDHNYFKFHDYIWKTLWSRW